MRLLKLPQCVEFFSRPGKEKGLEFIMIQANGRLLGGDVTFYGYEKEILERRVLEFDGVLYHFEFRNGGGVDYPSLVEGKWLVVDDFGDELKMKEELLHLLANNQYSKRKSAREGGGKVVGVLFEYPLNARSQRAFAIADVKTGECYAIPRRGLLNEYLSGDRVYVFHSRRRELLCLDRKLQLIWSFAPGGNVSPAYVSGPEIFEDVVIFSFGPTTSSKRPGGFRNGEQLADRLHLQDSRVFGCEREDGAVRWERVMPKSVDNMEVVGDKLYVSSANEIHILNPKTGETLQIVETGLSDDYDYSNERSSLHVEGEYLYFCHQADACILVYALERMELVRRVDIPEPYTVREFEYHHKASGRLYFQLRARFLPEYYHMRPILEVDPKNIQSDIEVFEGPPVEIELKPSEQNPDEQEVWVSLRDAPLDEAMVYAEMHTEDQAFYHGKQPPAFASVHVTDNFNGIVHLRYRGSDRPADEVRQKMAILEQRFAEWAENNAFASTDPSREVELEAQYVQ